MIVRGREIALLVGELRHRRLLRLCVVHQREAFIANETQKFQLLVAIKVAWQKRRIRQNLEVRL